MLNEEQAQKMIKMNEKIARNYKIDLVFRIIFMTMCVGLSYLCRYQDQKIESLEIELGLQKVYCKAENGKLKLPRLP
jgi:preprotein translocase subunit SecG